MKQDKIEKIMEYDKEIEGILPKTTEYFVTNILKKRRNL